jgi:hypothetical protein
MRKALIGLLLAATAASPAFAGKGGHGHGGGGGEWKHGGREDRGGWKHGGEHRGGGWKHAGDEHRGGGPGWARPAMFAQPVRVVRYDDKWARKQWKREAKEERRWARAAERRERFRPAERIVYVERYAPPRVAARYMEPAPVRYVERSYAPAYYSQPTGYWPAEYAPNDYSPLGAGATGLFGGGGNGLLGALLPVVLQSVAGGNFGLGGLGSGLSGLGGLGGYQSPDIYPLQLASYAPYSSSYGSGTSDLASMLLPSLLGNGSLF